MSAPTEDEQYEVGPPQRKCDPLLFLEALLPKVDMDTKHPGSAAAIAKRKAAAGCNLRIIDTITVMNGAIRTWLYNGHDGNIVDRKHYDRASIATSWRQHGKLYNIPIEAVGMHVVIACCCCSPHHVSRHFANVSHHQAD
jgi:hypothetical protein